jgi:uncharacterized membrane protein
MLDIVKYIIFVVGAIGILILILFIMKKRREAEAARAAETERILKASMDDLAGSSGSDPLVDKYS